MTIYFYGAKGRYGCFSNFSAHPIIYTGKTYPTSEHAFQAQKFLDPEIKQQIRTSPTPREAARVGKRRDFPLRSDWEEVKNVLMYEIVYVKFFSHLDAQEILLSTQNQEIVEDSPYDYYWGGGGRDRSGQNHLGKILMRVRSDLKVTFENK